MHTQQCAVQPQSKSNIMGVSNNLPAECTVNSALETQEKQKHIKLTGKKML